MAGTVLSLHVYCYMQSSLYNKEVIWTKDIGPVIYLLYRPYYPIMPQWKSGTQGFCSSLKVTQQVMQLGF